MKTKLSILIVLLFASITSAQQRPDDKLFNALTQVESSGNRYARKASEDACGIAQIRPGMVKDVNRILETDRYTLSPFTLSDRYSVEKSRQMFDVYMTHYGRDRHQHGKAVTYETLARMWPGGPDGPDEPGTQAYGHKVMQEMKRQESRK